MHRNLTALRTLSASALVAGLVALGACGGGNKPANDTVVPMGGGSGPVGGSGGVAGSRAPTDTVPAGTITPAPGKAAPVTTTVGGTPSDTTKAGTKKGTKRP